MTLPTFLKSKAFLIGIFGGTLILATLSVVGATLLRRGVSREEPIRAEEQLSLTAFTVSPASSQENWPTTVTIDTKISGCSPGGLYYLQYVLYQGSDAYYTEKPDQNPPTSLPYHQLTCLPGGTYSESFPVHREEITPSNSTPSAPPIAQSCSEPPCNYSFKVSIFPPGGSWQTFQQTAPFQITAPQPPTCTGVQVLRGSTPVTAISPGDSLTLRASGITAPSSTVQEVRFFYLEKPLANPVIYQQIGAGTDRTEGIWELPWSVPATFGDGDYDIFAVPLDANESFCTPYELPLFPITPTCPNCKAAVTVSSTPTQAPKCNTALTLDKTTTPADEPVTAAVNLNSGSSAFVVNLVRLHGATQAELDQGTTHNLGSVSACEGQTGDCLANHSFSPQDSGVLAGLNKIWISLENEDGLQCTDRPGGVSGVPTCGCQVKDLTVTAAPAPTCLSLTMTPLSAQVVAGQEITFTATFQPASATNLSFELTKPDGSKETIPCPNTTPSCTTTPSSQSVVAVLKYTPTANGQYQVKALPQTGVLGIRSSYGQ